MALAIDSYAALPALGDSPEVLNLAWTIDERGHLAVDLFAVIARELRSEVDEGLPFVASYFVQDPFGERVLAGAVARFFGADVEALGVTAGSGVGPLLSCVTALADRAPTYLATDVYPDLPYWAERRGSPCVTYADRLSEAPADARGHAEAALALGAGLVALERPCLTPDLFADLASVRELCEALAPHGIPVVVDESNANYWPPEFSAVALVATNPDLVVVRGLTKALGLGGLRLGYCVTRSGAPTQRLRSVVAPLLASSVSLRLGEAVVRLGDVTGPLRARIRAHRDEAGSLLCALGVRPAVAASEFLPYLLVHEEPEAALTRLRRAGVLGKLQPVWSAAARGIVRVCRVSVPLDEDRLERLRALTAPVR